MSGLWEIIAPFSADDVNEATQPSAEGAITNYTAAGTNTVAASTDFQWRGAYSLKVTYQNTVNPLFSYTHTFLSSATYYVKARVYVPANWNGGNLSLGTANYAGATTTPVETFVSGTDPVTTWVELVSTVTIVADDTGEITLVASGTPTAGRVIYFDGLYISTNNGIYFDGDTPMAFWRGNRHASASQMDYRNRAHGEATNFDDLAVYVGHPVGFDFPPIDTQTTPRALGAGSEYQGTYIAERVGQLPIQIVGTSEANYHTRKKAFENLIKPNAAPGEQAFILRSLAANTYNINHLKVHLDGDLSLKRDGFSGKGIMRVLANEPSWHERGDHYAAMTRSTSLSVSYILGWLNDGTGFSALGNTGTNTVSRLAIAENGDVYVVGTFLNWDGNADADRIVRYNRSAGTWSHLFTGGANANVSDILILDDGDVIFSGDFTSIGGSALNRAARWDGSSLTGFGTGFNAWVYAMAYDYKRGIIYFGGSFTTANGVAANRIVQYTLSTGVFTAMGTGMNNTVDALYVDMDTGDVYAGGLFTDSGRTRAGRWDYSSQAWASIGDGEGGEGFDADVYSITGDGHYIYFGGNFTQTNAGTVGAAIPVSYIARYIPGNHTHPEQVGGGVSAAVYFLKWDTQINKLFLSGVFSTIGSALISSDRTAYWNGTTYEKVPLDFPGSAIVYAFARNPVNGDYFIGFDTTGTMIVPGALNNLTNSGTDDAYPVFVFDSSADVIGTEYATLSTLTNRTTGVQVNFNDVRILAGSIVTVEFSPEGAKVYRLVGQSKVDLTNGAFTRDSETSTFVLMPGLNQVLLAAMDTNGTPSITCYCLFKYRHHSMSGTAT